MEDKLFKNLDKLIDLRNTWTNLINSKHNLATNIWNLVEAVKPAKDEVAKRLIAKLDTLMEEIEQEAKTIMKEIQEGDK